MKEWCIRWTQRPMPMSKYRGGPHWNKWPCTTFNWDHALTFETKEKAYDYLDKCFLKYGAERMGKWEPVQVKTLLRHQKAKPIFRLRSRINLFMNQPRV